MKNNSSDHLQYGINEAMIYFYYNRETESITKEIKVRTSVMNPNMMMGVGYLMAIGHLKYRGDWHFTRTQSGYEYYLSLIENGDISP